MGTAKRLAAELHRVGDELALFGIEQSVSVEDAMRLSVSGAVPGDALPSPDDVLALILFGQALSSMLAIAMRLDKLAGRVEE